MDTAAVVIPIPVQPIEPPQPAPSGEAPSEAGSGVADFATTLEQQIAQAVTAGANAAQSTLPGSEAGLDGSDTRDAGELATPDALIAMMGAPLFAQAAQPAPAEPRAGVATAASIAAAQGEQRELPERADARGSAGAPLRGEPLDFAAHGDVAQAAQTLEREAVAAPQLQSGEAPGASAAGLLHVSTTPASHTTAPAPARAEPQIAARVGTAEWNGGLAQQVTMMVKDGEQTAQLRLDPPELGPLEVRLSMARDQDGVAHAQFVSPHAAVREALEAALPQLRAVLADSGITLGQASVGEGYARDEAGEPRQPGGGRGHEREGGGVNVAPRALVRHGLVDTFA